MRYNYLPGSPSVGATKEKSISITVLPRAHTYFISSRRVFERDVYIHTHIYIKRSMTPLQILFYGRRPGARNSERLSRGVDSRDRCRARDCCRNQLEKLFISRSCAPNKHIHDNFAWHDCEYE